LTVKDLATTTNDTLAAGGSGQTLTGGGPGKVAFVGSAAGGDTFRNISALFNGDSVANFINAGNVIDLTDVNHASVSLGFTENPAMTQGTLTVTDGTHSAAITLFGQFMAIGFHTAPDGPGPTAGTNVTYQPPLMLAAVHHT
jgi:hypothetical protein